MVIGIVLGFFDSALLPYVSRAALRMTREVWSNEAATLFNAKSHSAQRDTRDESNEVPVAPSLLCGGYRARTSNWVGRVMELTAGS